MAPSWLPRLHAIHMDGRALFFSAAISILTGFIFGVVPAAQGSKSRFVESLRNATRGGSRQDDYYLVNLATMKLSTVASADTAFWLPGRDQIVYLTPQDLAPLPGGHRKRNVWVQQLMFFDPVKGTPITASTAVWLVRRTG